MAFSIRRMLSNIYFSKSDEENRDKSENASPYLADVSGSTEFERTDPDSTCVYATRLNLPNSGKKIGNKEVFSDTDSVSSMEEKKDKRRKKLKIGIKKASQSSENLNADSSNVENTPKHVLLKDDIFTERFKNFNFNRSFDVFDNLSVTSDEDIDIESLSESDTEVSSSNEKEEIKMCRKVESPGGTELMPSATPESFGDVELEKNEEDKITLLLDYQMKLNKVDCVLKKLLSDFTFYVDVSKIFNRKSIVSALPGPDMTYIPSVLEDITHTDNIQRGISPAGSWNIIMEKEDETAKHKLKTQLLSMKKAIDSFIDKHLESKLENQQKSKKKLCRSNTFNLHKGERHHKHAHLSNKKKIKHYDFPDLREAMINLFCPENTDVTPKFNDSESKCCCQCHCSTSSEADSGLTSKTDKEMSDQSITSSIGNFTLDLTTLSAYSESLDQIISYDSFDDSSLYSSLLQKASVERITFYVQVHSIQLKSELDDTRNSIVFTCPSCKITEHEEYDLLKHILSQTHCERIHFLYKTKYIKKCLATGKEIQPSSVLNPMTVYRDDNKIVCFGDAMYACTLCFENLMVGESVLMAHCTSSEHIDKKKKLYEISE